VDEIALEHIFLQVCIFGFPVHHSTITPIHLEPSPAVCVTTDQAAHYHILGVSAGGFISDRHLASYGITTLSFINILTYSGNYIYHLH
jgi:hypothetical protein